MQADANTHQKSEYVCLDYARARHSNSKYKNDNGALLYPTVMREGSSMERLYGHDSAVGCAVCSVPLSRGFVYPRWGHQTCPAGAKELYSGFMASSKHDHTGAGYNDLCMHPKPEKVRRYLSDSKKAVQSYLYGMEYKGNAHWGKDAACAMCEAPGAAATYVQWGRQECSSGHHTEYAGLIMGPRYNHQKGENVCVDYEQMGFSRSNKKANNEGLLCALPPC